MDDHFSLTNYQITDLCITQQESGAGPELSVPVGTPMLLAWVSPGKRRWPRQQHKWLAEGTSLSPGGQRKPRQLVQIRPLACQHLSPGKINIILWIRAGLICTQISKEPLGNAGPHSCFMKNANGLVDAGPREPFPYPIFLPTASFPVSSIHSVCRKLLQEAPSH